MGPKFPPLWKIKDKWFPRMHLPVFGIVPRPRPSFWLDAYACWGLKYTRRRAPTSRYIVHVAFRVLRSKSFPVLRIVQYLRLSRIVDRLTLTTRVHLQGWTATFFNAQCLPHWQVIVWMWSKKIVCSYCDRHGWIPDGYHYHHPKTTEAPWN